MKSILITLIILTFGLSTNAQNENNKLSRMKSEKPLIIINDTLIASIDLLNKVSSDKILKLNVFKEKELSSTNLFLGNKQNGGIIRADIKSEFTSKSQNELNSFFGLDEDNDVYINGYLLEDKNQDISTESIKSIELIKADNFRLKKSVLNIEIE